MGSQIFTVDEIKDILYPVFKSAPVRRATLFGSYSKGNATEKSDIDIVIDSDGALLNIDFYGVLEDITILMGKKVDLFEIAELRNNKAMLAAIEEGVVLYDREQG